MGGTNPPGGRTKGVPNKVTSEVKSKLQLLIDKTVDELL